MNLQGDGAAQQDTSARMQALLGQREQRWAERFARIESQSLVRWMHRDEFFALCDARAAARRPDELPRGIRQWEYPTTLLEIRLRVAEPPVFTPPDGDFPGPVERWYGAVGECLFTLEYDYAFSQFLCESEDADAVVATIRSALDHLFGLSPYEC